MGVRQELKTDEVLELVEFETKYEVDESLLHPFKQLVEGLNLGKCHYVQGIDVFFTKPGRDNIFARYRKADNDKRAEFTIKEKHTEANSIKRTETNWRVDNTDFKEIAKGAELMGFKENTTIWKSCHIYDLKDVIAVFYSVRGEDNKMTHFIEIEVHHKLNFTEEQAWDIIKKYEELFAPLGISAKKRKRKSLFEMYRKDN